MHLETGLYIASVEVIGALDRRANMLYLFPTAFMI